MNINNFWNDVIKQNRDALPSYFCDDAQILWHCTNEAFNVEEYVIANCDYPGKWNGKIEKIIDLDSQIILVGRVYSVEDELSCHVTSFIKLKDGKILELSEYWADDGVAPSWRKKLGIGKAIQQNTRESL